MSAYLIDLELIFKLSILYSNINGNSNIITLFFENINNEFDLNISTSWNTLTNDIEDFIDRIIDNLNYEQKGNLLNILY